MCASLARLSLVGEGLSFGVAVERCFLLRQLRVQGPVNLVSPTSKHVSEDTRKG